MKSRIFILLAIAGTITLNSCGSKKRAISNTKPPVSTPAPNTEKSEVYDQVAKVKIAPKNLDLTESYIYQFADIARQEMRMYGIPASITLAQGILESGNGQGNLTSRSNNHFGIKCNGWQGAKVYHDDDKAQECFRKYTRAEYSYRDHSLFLATRNRYAFLFNYNVTDYKSWAKGLKKAGYATDPRYPDKLIGLIERYKLYEYDKNITVKLRQSKPEVVSTTQNPEAEKNPDNEKTSNPEKNTTTKTHTVKAGDTLYNISKRYNMDVEELKKLNNLKNNIISIGQVLKLN
mgnify:CR=1 FL=1